jgi:N-acetylneuraminic acid mutarotase
MATHIDPTQGHGTWVDTGDTAARVGGAAATTVFGQVVFTGGDPVADTTAQPTTDTFVRGPGINALWGPGPALPAARMFQAMAADSSGNVYVIGGQDAAGPVSTVFRFNPAGGGWTAVASLPVAADGMAAATGPDGRIWVMGGAADAGGCCITLRRLFVYTPATNTWAEKAQMPTGRFSLGAAFGRDGRLYAIGGRLSVASTLTVNTVEAYDPATDTWSAAAPDLFSTIGAGVSRGPDGLIYVAGGTDLNPSPAQTHSAVRVYNPDTNAWAHVPALLTARDSLALTAGSDGELYAIAGETVNASGSFESTSATEYLVVAANETSPTSHGFGNTVADQTKTFTITVRRKAGIAGLQVDDFDFDGAGASAYSVSSDTCIGKDPTVLECTVTVRFAPTTLGPQPANLLVEDLSNDAPHRVALTGTGTPGGLRVDPATIQAPAGEGRAFTATFLSATGRSLQDATPQAAFTITPDGGCTANVCRAGLPGPHQISAFVSPFTGNATFDATAPVLPPPPGPENPVAPSNRFTIGGTELNRRKGTARQQLNVPGPGSLVLQGRGIVSRTVPVAAPSLEVLVKARGKARARLDRKGKVTVSAAFTYTPAGGEAATQTTPIVLSKNVP